MTTVTDPTTINWPERQARAAIPFQVIDGRPVNPVEHIGIRGLNGRRAWGENLAADALVTATDEHGKRLLVMVERRDGYGWAMPGGHVEPGESPADAVVRELAEEASLRRRGVRWTSEPPQYVADPRASDEAWMVTVLHRADLGRVSRADLPTPVGGSDAKRADWVPADDYSELVGSLAVIGGEVFVAHRTMLRAALNGRR